MREFSKNEPVGKAIDALKTIDQMHIPTHAANAGYFVVMAVFPALLLLMSILRYTPLEVETLLEVLDTLLPTALMGVTTRLVNSCYQNTSGTVVGVSAIAALWSASRGMHGLLTGLNAVYGVSENRNYFLTRGLSMLYTFLFLLVLLLTLVLHVFGNIILGFFSAVDNPVVHFLVGLVDLRFFLLLIVQTLIFTLMYVALPNQRNRFWQSFPGGLLSSLGWLIFSDLFSMYVEHYDQYSNIYGSIYTLALGMLWLYFCMMIIFFGGALNRWLAEEQA